LKQRKENYVFILSSISIIRESSSRQQFISVLKTQVQSELAQKKVTGTPRNQS